MIKLCTFGIAAVLQAQIAPAQSMSDHWRAMTKADVDASYALLHDNHPAAVPELGDVTFQKSLSDGYKLALERAGEVENFDGYAATLAGFSQSFGDKHIWSRLNYTPRVLKWPGLLLAKRGPHWVVVDTEPEEADLKGADLVSCDGKPADRLGRERIGGFRAYWAIEAQRIQQTPWLLVDSGNPFLPPLKTCKFVRGQTARTLTLNWRDARSTDLTPRISAAAGLGKAGFGVRRFAGGSWISLEKLNDQAPAVIEAVQRQMDAINSSRFVVVDLRGNGGGNSEYGRQLAKVLLGSSYVDAVLQSSEVDCSVWRASPGNLETVENNKKRFGPQFGPEAERRYDQLIADFQRAQGEGRAFSGPLTCPASVALNAAGPRPPWPVSFKLVLLTDATCFSSCLLVADDLRKLGAIHVGQTTDAATRYMEVREVLLPSGLSYFSTLQDVDLAAPADMGPFVPNHVYDGDIADTSALESWLIQVLS